jgi:leader peptidase (prepilin peptidase)/N-methyltransferase
VGGARDVAGGHPRSDRRERVTLDAQEPARATAWVATALAFVRALPRTWQVAVGVSSVALAAACLIRFGLNGRAVVGAVFAAVLVLLSAIDLDCRLIPNVIVLPATVLLLLAQIALYPHHALEWVLASFLAALGLFLPLLVVPTGMGMGDVKLAALLGAVLGASVVVALLVGLLAGGLFSLALLIRGGMSARKQTFAYGPFLAFGGLVVLLLGGH